MNEHQDPVDLGEHDDFRTHFIAKKPTVTLDQDLILPARTRVQINECLTGIRHHHKIYYEWNFRSVDPLGRGTVLNFHGPPGTGKTLASEAFAGTLGLPFIPIGIAEIESKFMGETAKQIQRAFHEAHELGAVLLFDEADTLLGKRLTSVTQGVDHEVNSMRSTMLIELERFEGIVIFASNFARNYDEAFRSRISYHVRFELPDIEARVALWRRMLVSEIPLRVNREELAATAALRSEGFSGREIRTSMRLALPKALLDDTDSSPTLTVEHLLEAIDEVKEAQAEIASPRPAQEATIDVTAAKTMLGVK